MPRLDKYLIGATAHNNRTGLIKMADEEEMRDWVFDRIENSNKTSTQIRKEFIVKFGKSNIKYYNKYESEMVD